MKAKNKLSKKLNAAASKLIRDPLFLFRVVQKVGELGIVGEKRNGLVFFLAAITKDLDKPVSLLEKGASSTGKVNWSRLSYSYFHPNASRCVPV